MLPQNELPKESLEVNHAEPERTTSGAEARKQSGALAARLKPCPFKTVSVQWIDRPRIDAA